MKMIVEKVILSTYVDCCDREWSIWSRDILQKNGIDPYVYAEATGNLLIHGRGKFRNLMITGPENCVKTFMLKSLEIIYNAFSNPENDKYAWVGADKEHEITFQDFKWSSELIYCKDWLLFLKDEPVKLPSSKNQFATYVSVRSNIPNFITTKAKIEFTGKPNQSDNRETKMTDVR